MRHVGQELALTPIRRFCLLPRRRILFNRFPEVVHHLVDLRLERVHLTRRFDSDEPREVAVGRCRRDLGKRSDLRCKVGGHRVDI